MNELLKLAWSDFLSLFFIFIRVGTILAIVPFFNATIIPRRITAINRAFFKSCAHAYCTAGAGEA